MPKTHSEAFFTLTIRKSRDMCRSIIGPDVTFIVLSLTKSCQMKRLAGRDQLYEIVLPGKSIIGDYFQENMTS